MTHSCINVVLSQDSHSEWAHAASTGVATSHGPTESDCACNLWYADSAVSSTSGMLPRHLPNYSEQFLTRKFTANLCDREPL